MTLQKLLLKLSRNDSIIIECSCSNEQIIITLYEWQLYSHGKILLQVEMNLNEKIDVSKFLPFIQSKS